MSVTRGGRVSILASSAITRPIQFARRRVAILSGVMLLVSVAQLYLSPSRASAVLTNDEILVKVGEVIERGQATSYSAVREYHLRNHRFGKEAIVFAQVSYSPDAGKDFTILQSSGSPKLIEIVQKLFESEIEVSRPAAFAAVAISPANYRAQLRGIDTKGKRACYAIDLIPKRRSKYLIKGTAWIDRESYGLVRIEGTTSASVSMWIGSPHILQEFEQIGGFWFPVHTGSLSSGFLLGASELEIRYTDYLVTGADHSAPNRIATDGLRQLRQ
jgi:hypothetical protein